MAEDFTHKLWENTRSETLGKIDAASLIDLEERLSGYSKSIVEPLEIDIESLDEDLTAAESDITELSSSISSKADASALTAHNISGTAHSDIRSLIAAKASNTDLSALADLVDTKATTDDLEAATEALEDALTAHAAGDASDAELSSAIIASTASTSAQFATVNASLLTKADTDDVNDLLDLKSDLEHTHTVEEVIELDTLLSDLADDIDSIDLSGKSDVGHTHDEYALEGITGAVNVKHSPYSAAGDGTTNDTAAIQAAIDAVTNDGGGTVFFPKGIYIVHNLVLKKNVELKGVGWKSILKAPSSASTGSVIRTLNVATGDEPMHSSIRNMRIDGNRRAGASEVSGISLLSTNSDAFWSYYTMDETYDIWNDPSVRIEGCLVNDCGAFGIILGRNYRGSFVSNTFVVHARRTGIVVKATDIQLSNIQIGGCGDGIYFDGVNGKGGHNNLTNVKAWYAFGNQTIPSVTGQFYGSGRGFYIDRSEGVQLTGVEAQDCVGGGFILDGAKSTVIRGVCGGCDAGSVLLYSTATDCEWNDIEVDTRWGDLTQQDCLLRIEGTNSKDNQIILGDNAERNRNEGFTKVIEASGGLASRNTVDYKKESTSKKLAVASNLSDVASASTARTNLAAASQSDLSALAGAYRLIHQRWGAYNLGQAAGSWLMYQNGLIGVNAVNSSVAAIYLDPADLPTVAGLTKKLRLRGWVASNAAGGGAGVSYTFGLWPCGTIGGASGQLPRIQSIGTATIATGTLAAPPANMSSVVSGEIDFPAAGWYAFGVFNSATLPANVQPIAFAELAWRYAA